MEAGRNGTLGAGGEGQQEQAEGGVIASLHARVLAGLALEHGWRALAELGVLHCATTEHLLKACPELSVLAVDTWRHGDPALDPLPGVKRRSAEDSGHRSYIDVDMETAYEWALSLAARYPRRLQVMRMDTLSAAERVPERSLDAVFCDASHQTEAVEADIKAWLPNIRRGGWLTGHDIGHHSVRAAVERMFGGNYETRPGNIWTVRI